MTKWNGMKNAMRQVAYFLNRLRLRYFRLPMRNLGIIWPLKSKLSGKFQRFSAIDGSIEMLKNSWISKKIQLNEKLKYRSTRPKQWGPLKKSSHLPPSPPHQIKSYYVFGTKIFLIRYTEIYKNLLSKCFKNAVLGCQEMVQCKCFFWHQTETCFLKHL